MDPDETGRDGARTIGTVRELAGRYAQISTDKTRSQEGVQVRHSPHWQVLEAGFVKMAVAIGRSLAKNEQVS